MGRLTLALTAMLCAQSASAAGGPLELTPVGAWRANYADDSCSLERDFSSGEELVALRLRQFAPAEPFEITIASDTFSLSSRKPRYRFEPADNWRDVIFHETIRNSSVRAVVFTGSLYDEPVASVSEAARELRDKTIEGLTVEDGFTRDIFLRTGPLDAPMKAMRACLDDLLISWDLDAAAHHLLSRPVTEKDGEQWPAWLEGDFRAAVIDWPSSRIEFLLLVDEAGRISGCRIVNAPRDNEQAIRVCEAVPRDWQFEPALDAAGRPIKSYHRDVITKVARADYQP